MNGLDGSTETTPTLRPSPRAWPTRALTRDDFPTPGGPVTPVEGPGGPDGPDGPGGPDGPALPPGPHEKNTWSEPGTQLLGKPVLVLTHDRSALCLIMQPKRVAQRRWPTDTRRHLPTGIARLPWR